MRALILALSAATLSGCLTLEKPLCPGTRAYDPQICRGEKWTYIPNPPMYALQQQEKCNKCIDVEQNCVWGVPKQCKPQWKWDQK
jgi:hypothetical protein